MPYFPIYMDCQQPRRLADQHFGLGLTPNDHLTVLEIPQSNSIYLRQWRNMQTRDTGTAIKEDKDKYQVYLDVQHFAQDEIAVKASDGFLVVEARHDERIDEHGFVARSFVRKYTLPVGVDEDLLTSTLSSDGVLTIVAPLRATKAFNERIVPIMQTGPVKKTEEGHAKDY